MSTVPEIDRELCIGSGNCVHLARGAIALDEEGVATIVEGASVTPDQLQQAERSCPTGAISVLQGDH
ncbi:ferredoxin [Qaidamihabitans albus]|uniref:ferredoxin n=1 Tax=Qaidamihabitans albus TaxID=2795733 RepID=UPI0018F20F92|nr:ferredoxin [Qaidamihabitans albus]